MSATNSVFLVLAIFSFFTFSVNAEAPLLKESDIQRIMSDIFRQHVDKKKMTAPLFTEASKAYIDELDPDKLYLLDSEVEPYQNLSSGMLAQRVQQYDVGHYDYFTSLYKLMQNAVMRAVVQREKQAAEYKSLVIKVSTGQTSGKEAWGDFAPNLAEIDGRQKDHFKSYVEQWQHRYGKARTQGHEDEIWSHYKDELSFTENQFLGLHPDRKPLSEQEKESFVVLYILKALAGSLDSHTKVYDPSEAVEMRTRLERGFQGVGLEFRQGSAEEVFISRIVDKSAAAKNGQLKPGDQLIEVNGRSIQGQAYQDVIKMIKGDGADRMTFKFVRPSSFLNKQILVDLKKERIDLEGSGIKVSQEKFGNGIIGTIKLDSFYQSDNGISSEKDVKEAIERLEKENLRGLILDLRENRGGFLTQAVKVAGLFITNGIVVISKYSSGEEKIYRDTDGKTSYQGPLVVLVSKMTASAAEIVAQALQDYGVALIVGDEHTYGKGTIQSQTVTDGAGASSYFKVTVGKYFTVSGKTPQLQGVRSDIVVPGPLANVELGEEFLKETLAADTIPDTYNDSLKDVDPQLKNWYLKYYLPTLQPRSSTLSTRFQQLRADSGDRIANNLDYQNFLRNPKEKFPKGNDYQLNEAYNIVKEVIYLESKESKKNYEKMVEIN